MARPQPNSTAPDSTQQAMKIPPDLRLWACERLVTGVNRRQAARSLVSSASTHGIDLDLMWGVISDHAEKSMPRVRQVCLAVLGAGRTAMLFHSSPESPRQFGSREVQQREIGASISACLVELSTMPDRAGLAQCLIEPKHTWANQVCLDAGMISVGELAYMRKPLDAQRARPVTEPDWGPGIRVESLASIEHRSPGQADPDLTRALEGSYEQTLDCPELCGLRSMPDVLESHKATGSFDPNHWLLIYKHDQPVGCCLLTHCPNNDSIELVYLGIAPDARGLGLGRRVLEYGIARMSALCAKDVTCAVDTRNTPAIHVYESLGFRRFDSRHGYVVALPLG